MKKTSTPRKPKPMRAFHGKSAIKTDELCVELLRREHVRVDALNGIVYAKRFAGKALGSTNGDGYLVCTLHLDGARKQIKLHRLIWISVNGIPPAGLMPDHENRVRSDNR